MIKKLTDSEHILKRPSMYIGSISNEIKSYHIFENNKFIKKEIFYNQGLVKIFNEILDNSIDVAVKNNFKVGNKIKITLENDYFIIEDNGTGIPVIKQDGEYLPKIAWGYARSGSNFDDTNRTSIGLNGIGSFATNVFSVKFIGESFDGKKHYKGVWQNNSKDYKEIIKFTTKTGVKVTVYPDFKRFSKEKFDENDELIIKSRIYMLSLTYPEINFYYNNEKIQVKNWSF